MSEIRVGQNMLLINDKWQDHDTFKMIPVTLDAPYVEVIYDRRFQTLCIISKTPIEKLTMLPRLNNDGELESVKKPKANGKGYKEQRVFMKSFNEHYFSGEEQIRNFVKLFAVNADSFDIESLLPKLVDKTILQNSEAGSILGENGEPLPKTAMTEA